MNKCQNDECKVFMYCPSQTPGKEYIKCVVMENQACFVFSNNHKKEVDLDFVFVVLVVILVSCLKKAPCFSCYTFLTFHLNNY